MIDHRVEVGRAFGKARAVRSDIGIVKAEERLAEDRKKVESGVGLGTRRVEVLSEPGALEGLSSERIATGPCEAVPPGDREAQVVFKPLAVDLQIGVVVAEGEPVACVRALISDGIDLREIAHGISFRAV